MDTSRIPRIPRGLAATFAAGTLLALTACGGTTAPAATPGAPAASAAAGSAAVPHPLTTADVDAWLDGYLPAALEREGIPGASVAVVHDGEVVTTRGFGWADREAGEPVDPADTLFRVGSVSKVFTATAVMQLVEDGAVDLDTDVGEYVDVDLERPVTLRHLLTHTGGFEEKVAGLIRGPGETVDLRETLTTDPPEQVYEPGTVPAYSNYGNALAGLVVEEVDGRPFEQYVADEVLAPAGMTSSSFAQPLPEPLADRLAAGYADATAPPVEFETVGTPPAGALTSSADDMARFMLAQLGEEPALLAPATRDRMFAPGLDEDALGGLAAGPRMTLGWFDRSRGGHRVVEHGGDTNVFHSDLALWPDEGSGIFVTMNGSGSDALSTVDLRNGLLEGFADRYHPGDEPAAAATGDADDQAAALAGTYETSRTIRSNFLAAAFATGQTTIEAEDDGRVLITPGPNAAEPARYEPVGDWTWREVGGSSTIAARAVGGEVEAVGYDSAFTLLPVPAHRSAAVVVPVVGASTAVLVATLLGGLVLAPVRWVRRRRDPAEADRADRSVRPDRTTRVLQTLVRVGVTATVAALVGWVLLVAGVMTFQTPSPLVIRSLQALQVVGLLAVVPAVARVALAVRHREGVRRVVAAAVVALALAGTGWAAVTLRLLSPDISY
ncbi:beta-lactamase family protein [Nocardioides sp. ChNu-153]|uniref:serine hydrolase domain-containing protein n=1 Tax=unclassified Nocardioides TaxID=2615069 RepID=UPI002405DD51|nr:MULTISPECIES: serine hydrolase domain-containing protein [unclassified Nocardioides]MDF9716701.1 beta-lactamase family protein [Nocardioides sp. ChNu-99]MDN7121149.1 beta-lactamase family protein [Nocardioides sp. ChNu-153]